jgi:hypothetical protein
MCTPSCTYAGASPDSSGLSQADFAGPPVLPSGHPGHVRTVSRMSGYVLRARVAHVVALSAHGCCRVARRPCWRCACHSVSFLPLARPRGVAYSTHNACVYRLNKALPCRYASRSRLRSLAKGLRPLEPPVCACTLCGIAAQRCCRCGAVVCVLTLVCAEVFCMEPASVPPLSPRRRARERAGTPTRSRMIRVRVSEEDLQ